MSDEHAIAADGTAYDDQGQGPVVVLLHGLGLDRHMWQTQVQRLATDHRVVAPDALGHGESPPADDALSLDDLVRQVVALLDHLQVADACLVGYDLGGQVALSVAAQEPARVTSLVLVSTAFRRLKAQRDLLLRRVEQARRHGPSANVDAAIQRWFSAAFQASHRDAVTAVRERLASNDASSYVAAARVHALADTHTADAARRVSCPALVMCGALDMGATPDMARRLVAEMSSARLMVVPRQRHMLPLEAPELVSDAIRSAVAPSGSRTGKAPDRQP